MEKKVTIKKVFKIFLLTVIMLILIVIIHTVRNYIIITNLQDRISQYAESNNFYVKTVTNYENENMFVTNEFYRKGDKCLRIITRDGNGKIAKLSLYNNGQTKDMFIDGEDATKTAKLNIDYTFAEGAIYNNLESESNWITFLGSIFARVKSINYENKKCYEISNFISATSISYVNEKIFIEKDTGLLVKTEGNKEISERMHEFNNVDDSIFIEPDISQYIIVENN